MSGQIRVDPSRVDRLDEGLRGTVGMVEEVIRDEAAFLRGILSSINSSIEYWDKKRREAWNSLITFEEFALSSSSSQNEAYDLKQDIQKMVDEKRQAYENVSEILDVVKALYEECQSAIKLYTSEMDSFSAEYCDAVRKSSYILQQYSKYARESSAIIRESSFSYFSMKTHGSTELEMVNESINSHLFQMDLQETYNLLIRSILANRNMTEVEKASRLEMIRKELIDKSRSDFLGKTIERLSEEIQRGAYLLLAEYMSINNYAKESFPPSYCNDPNWRVLHKMAYPNIDLPPMDSSIAKKKLYEYMRDNNYGKEDKHIYMHDLVWVELNKYASTSFSSEGIQKDENEKTFSKEHAIIIESLKRKGVAYLPIEIYVDNLSVNDILRRLGGRDKTRGSCSSLAFAYIGNRGGYNVLDYRDGESRLFFARNDTIEAISMLPGVKGEIVRGTNDFSCASELLRKVQDGKEYYFATGQHAAIVRKQDDEIEYLELQRPKNNGWYKLDKFQLAKRFHCSILQDQEYPSFLIDVETLIDSKDFLDILGYINTSNKE